MNVQTVKTRLQKTKDYVKDRIPQLVTATAALGTLYIAHKHSAIVRDYIMDDRNFRRNCQAAIDRNEDAGHRYKFFPGVGVLTFPDDENPPEN